MRHERALQGLDRPVKAEKKPKVITRDDDPDTPDGGELLNRLRAAVAAILGDAK